MRWTARAALAALLTVGLVFAALISSAPAPAAQAASDCGCAGDYVSPEAKGPSVAEPKGDSTSPKGTYALTVSTSSLTVSDAKSGQTVLTLSGLSGDFHAGFGPNDRGFVVWSLSASGGHVSLYDLASTSPSHVVWSNDYLGSFSLGFSPHGQYFLIAAAASAQFTALTVVDALTGHHAYGDQLPSNTRWGFSPDDKRLALWSGDNSGAASSSSVILYDLAVGRQVWRTDGAFGSTSLAFSPHGAYFVSAAITSGSHADLAVVPAAASGGEPNAPVYQASFNLYAPPGHGEDTFGSAAWGFSPDKEDSTFVYDAVAGQSGVSVVMVHLPTRAAHPFSYSGLVSGWWQFSPCGDAFAIVIQPNASASVDVGLYSTATGETLATNQFSSLSVSLKATEAYHVATVDGTDYNLAKNAGHADCGTSGGSGSGSGGPGVPPCPSCYAPAVVLNDLQVSPIIAAAGGQVTGTLSVTNSGAVSLSSSDPAAASVPAVVNVSSGDTTFPIAIGPVSADTLVTITATAGGTTRIARLVVEAPCAASSAGDISAAIAAAPIRGGGGGPQGPGGGGFDRPVIEVSVDPLVVTDGTTATGSVSLSDARSTDVVVALFSGDPAAASVPASLTVPAGQTTATFTVTGHAVVADELVSIRASAGGYLAIGATVAVAQPPTLASLTLDTASVVGGKSATGAVALSGAGAACQAQTVTLSSSDDGVASVPASVTVPAGADGATFTIATRAVTSTTAVTIVASLNGTSRSATLTVNPPAPPSAVSNDNLADAASLDLPGIFVGDTSKATMEPGEPVLSGTCAVLGFHQLQRSVWFKLTPSQSGVLTVSTANAGTNFDSVLALYADPGSGGVGSLGTPMGCDNNGDALRSADSGSSDMTLYHLEHTGPDAGSLGGLPTWSSIMHVAVQAGQTYYVQLGGVGGAPAGHYVLTAEINPAIVLPSMLEGVSVGAATLGSGGTATGTVTLSEPAPAGGIIVAVTSDNGAVSVPDAVVVEEGSTSASFAVTAGAPSTSTAVTITGSFDGAQRKANLTVSP